MHWVYGSEGQAPISRDNLAIDPATLPASQFINGRLASLSSATLRLRRPIAQSFARLGLQPVSARDGIEDVMHQPAEAGLPSWIICASFIRLQPDVHHLNLAAGDVYQKIESLQNKSASSALKPIFIALEEKMSYDEIRIAVAYLSSSGGNPA